MLGLTGIGESGALMGVHMFMGDKDVLNVVCISFLGGVGVGVDRDW